MTKPSSNATTQRIHPEHAPATQAQASPAATQSASLSEREGAGRVLCIGGSVAKEVETQLGQAQYQVGHLETSSDIEELICKAVSFLPDIIYLALEDDLQPSLDILEAFSKDSRTLDFPLLCLVSSQAKASVIQEAFSRTECDFFRLDSTRVELLARTSMMIRLCQQSQGSFGATGASSSTSGPGAANQHSVGRVDLRDERTNLFSVSYFFHRLPTEVSRARRYKRALSLVAIRCEEAKHDQDVAARVSEILQKHLRDSDIPARLESNLFVCLLPEVTSDKLMALEQRLHRDFERASIVVKIGHAGLDGESTGCSPQDLVERARESAERSI